jgi:hypothetical protein
MDSRGHRSETATAHQAVHNDTHRPDIYLAQQLIPIGEGFDELTTKNVVFFKKMLDHVGQ